MAMDLTLTTSVTPLDLMMSATMRGWPRADAAAPGGHTLRSNSSSSSGMREATSNPDVGGAAPGPPSPAGALGSGSCGWRVAQVRRICVIALVERPQEGGTPEVSSRLPPVGRRRAFRWCGPTITCALSGAGDVPSGAGPWWMPGFRQCMGADAELRRGRRRYEAGVVAHDEDFSGARGHDVGDFVPRAWKVGWSSPWHETAADLGVGHGLTRVGRRRRRQRCRVWVTVGEIGATSLRPIGEEFRSGRR